MPERRFGVKPLLGSALVLAERLYCSHSIKDAAMPDESNQPESPLRTTQVSAPSSADTLAPRRIIALEELFTHLQRTIHDLDGVVLAQHKHLERLDRRVTRLERDLESLSRSTNEDRSPLDERPPHY